MLIGLMFIFTAFVFRDATKVEIHPQNFTKVPHCEFSTVKEPGAFRGRGQEYKIKKCWKSELVVDEFTPVVDLITGTADQKPSLPGNDVLLK
jgi:hypothetical protein